MDRARGSQRALFDEPPRALKAAAPRPEHGALAARLPPTIRFGTMSWNFPGWIGKVYDAGAPKTRLADRGLPAYASHPLHRAVEVDRTYYEAPAADFFRTLAAQVPDDFQFLVKAHEECTVFRFPLHARYGKRRGELNGRFLDAAYTSDAVVGPTVEGLAGKAGALLFQFPPQLLDAPGAFADRLHDFLRASPGTHVRGRAAQRGAVHACVCRCAARRRGGPLSQRLERDAAAVAAGPGRPSRRAASVVVRWLLRPATITMLPRTLSAVRSPSAGGSGEPLGHRPSGGQGPRDGVPALITVNNAAEGCAPDGIALLAEELAARIVV